MLIFLYYYRTYSYGHISVSSPEHFLVGLRLLDSEILNSNHQANVQHIKKREPI